MPVSPHHGQHSTCKAMIFDTILDGKLYLTVRVSILLVRSQVDCLLTYRSPVSISVIMLPVCLRTRTMCSLWDQVFYCPWYCQCHLVVVCKYFVMKLCWETRVLCYTSVRETLYFPFNGYVISITIQHDLCSTKCLHFPLKWILPFKSEHTHNIYIIHCYKRPNLLLPTYIWQFGFFFAALF